jgi:hypothetical protein
LGTFDRERDRSLVFAVVGDGTARFDALGPRLDGVIVGIRVDRHRHLDVLFVLTDVTVFPAATSPFNTAPSIPCDGKQNGCAPVRHLQAGVNRMFETALGVGFVVVLFLSVYVLHSHTSTSETTAADGGVLPESPGTETGSETEGKTAGLVRWLTTTDHKDIGIMYIVFGTVAALWGGFDAMMIRTELLTPAVDVWTEGTYDALFTTHGLTMLILFVTPVAFGLVNYFLPLLIGADDLAFPRLNLLGFWLLPPALLFMRGGLTINVLAKFLGLFPSMTLSAFCSSSSRRSSAGISTRRCQSNRRIHRSISCCSDCT